MELHELVRAYISYDGEEEKKNIIALLDKHGYCPEEEGNDFICVDISGCDGEWDTIKGILDGDYEDDDVLYEEIEHNDGTMIDEDDGERLREHDDWERY